MYRRPSKKKQLIKRILVYAAMTTVVLITVTGLVFVILGYRIDGGNGHVEQGALLQFDSNPSGATVTIDNNNISARTPMKSSVVAGVHTFKMIKSGYEPWSKTVDIKAGTLTWLDYTKFVPVSRPIAIVANYSTIVDTKASPTGNFILVQQDASQPSWQLVDLRADSIKTATIAIPTTSYSEAATVGMVHVFKVTEWDSDGRYVLVKHTYNDKIEWLVVDTQNVAATKNITQLFGLAMTSVHFSGTSGAILYALTDGDLRKFDVSAATISRTFVSKITSFEIYNTNIISYIGTNTTDPAQRVVGLYKEGDNLPYILRSTTSNANIPLAVATTHYFNNDYIAITEGNKVTLSSGSYPSSGVDGPSSLSQFASFNVDFAVDRISFSKAGSYLLMQSGAGSVSYDLEHKLVSKVFNVSGAGVNNFSWLDKAHLWSDAGGQLMMRDYDGTNAYIINPVLAGQDATFTQNGRYFYSIGSAVSGYQLQRVRMTLL